MTLALAFFSREYMVKEAADVEGWVAPASMAAAATLAALVFLDRIADHFDSRQSAEIIAIAEDVAEHIVLDLRQFIHRCAYMANKTDSERKQYARTLSMFLVVAAAKGIPGGSRASYYTLTGKPGQRRLEDPEHEVQGGRSDQPDRPFIEAESPDNTIWTLIERADTEPQVVSAPNTRDGIDWNNVHYEEYYSVPVQHDGHTYGLLSVNASRKGAILGSHRAAILAMAKSYAFALALSVGRHPKSGSSARRTSSDTGSVSSVTSSPREGGSND